MQKRTLLIEDDIVLGNIMTFALQEEGYKVHFQSTLAAIKTVVKEFSPHIAILDVEIGDEDGIAHIAEIKKVIPELPVIIISSHTESAEVKRALLHEAIAYLKKPFEMEELMAYINRHALIGKPATISFGNLTLCLQSRVLSKGEESIKRLTPLEHRLLCLLLEHKGEIVTIPQLQEAWKGNAMNEHTLYNYMGKLRKTLSVDPSLSLESAGGGYVLF